MTDDLKKAQRIAAELRATYNRDRRARSLGDQNVAAEGLEMKTMEVVMPSSKWTDEHDRKLRAMWQTSMTQIEIPRRLGFSAAHISKHAEALGLPPRLSMNSVEERYLTDEADKRGVTPRILREKIISTVLHDHLVSAVLDDVKDQNADALS